jgi:hypothetical protein
MVKDPIVEEIHRIREELLIEHGGLGGYIQHLEEMKAEIKDRLVRLEPRKPVITHRKAS